MTRTQSISPQKAPKVSENGDCAPLHGLASAMLASGTHQVRTRYKDAAIGGLVVFPRTWRRRRRLRLAPRRRHLERLAFIVGQKRRISPRMTHDDRKGRDDCPAKYGKTDVSLASARPFPLMTHDQRSAHRGIPEIPEICRGKTSPAWRRTGGYRPDPGEVAGE